MKSAFLIALALSVSAPNLHAQTGDNPSERRTLEELVVVGARLPVADYKVGRAVTILDQDQIADLGYQYAVDLFRFVPGVTVSRAGGYGGLSQLRLRGSEANHVLVLVDGVDVSAADTGEFDFSSLLTNDIERIEVLRGPQSGLYGSNALAGVISIHTRRPDEGLNMDVHLEGGDDTTRHGAVSVAAGTARLQGRLNYTQRQTDFDLSSNDAVIGAEDDEDDNQTLSGQLKAELTDNLSLNLFGRLTERDIETDGFDFSGGPQQGLPIDDRSESETEDRTLSGVFTFTLADGRSVSRLGYDRTDTELDGGTFGSDTDREQLRFDTAWEWAVAGDVAQRTTLFIQDEEETFRNPFPFDPSQAVTQSRDLTGYGFDHRIEIGDTLFVNGSVRRDENDDFDDETTYSLDVAYLVNEGNTRLRASYGTGVTNPTFFEQFGFVPGTFIGNPDLAPEKSRSWDAGIEHTFGEDRLTVALTYFDADLEDEIQSLFPSVINLDGTSKRDGVELSATYQPGEHTTLTATYSYIDAEEPGGAEVRRPDHTGSLSIAHRLLDGRLKFAGNLVFNGEQLDNDFRNFFVNGFVAERTELDSYTLVNANVSYDISDAVEVYVRVENLFDEDYEEVIGYATPGRTALAGVRLRFGR